MKFNPKRGLHTNACCKIGFWAQFLTIFNAIESAPSLPKYEIEGDAGHGVHAFIINSMGSSLPEVKRDPYYYKSTVQSRDLVGNSIGSGRFSGQFLGHFSGRFSGHF